MAVWPKVKTVIDYCKKLPESKQPGRWKPRANVSCDLLCAALNDSLTPLKLLFFRLNCGEIE